jgi:hypothetical protein
MKKGKKKKKKERPKVKMVYVAGVGECICVFQYYAAFTLDDVKSVLNENLGGILGGTQY